MAIEMSGQEHIFAPIETVWAALNDPTTLEQCIPGCEKLDGNGEASFNAIVLLRVGPIKARFKGAVNLDNIEAPNSYTISGEGKGGMAGFAKGVAEVSLAVLSPGETILTYTASAEIGGKLAQLGNRIVQSTSKKLAAEFFTNLNRTISET